MDTEPIEEPMAEQMVFVRTLKPEISVEGRIYPAGSVVEVARRRADMMLKYREGEPHPGPASEPEPEAEAESEADPARKPKRKAD